ncbi:Fic family protein [Kitasatospora sp. NPDC051853]|uniref:Fic family protein n=1 Tax=Kitasatospora sp. NPDC051853 TaxID=3364058 RepID=UPI00379EAA5D
MFPVDPPLDAEAVPAGDRLRALAVLAELTKAAARLDNPDLFFRPRFRTALHRQHLRITDEQELAEAVSTAAEERNKAGLLAVHSVREELREHPGRRPCFTPDTLAELHRLIAAADPNIPGRGGFRRGNVTVTRADGGLVAFATAPGAELDEQVRRWYEWGLATTSPALDAAALSTIRLLTIHPFPDGNGRMVRLLAQCDLVAAGLMPGLLLDLEGWVHGNRQADDDAFAAAVDGDLMAWGASFARMVTETAHHRIATIKAYRRVLDAAMDRAKGDPAAREVLAHFRATPAVSAAWLRGRTTRDPGPALERLTRAGVLAPHPRLPGALFHPRLLAVLDEPFVAKG